MVKYSFFKNSADKTEVLLFLIFYWLMVVMPIICIMGLLVGTFDVVLNNVGGVSFRFTWSFIQKRMILIALLFAIPPWFCHK